MRDIAAQDVAAQDVAKQPASLPAVTPAEAVAAAVLPRAPEDLPVERLRLQWLARFAPLAPFVAISAGAALGANARYVVGLWAAAQWGSTFPWGTRVINVTGR